MGTPAYMAPEQFQDFKRADSRANVYSFGVMLSEMVNGQWLVARATRSLTVGGDKLIRALTPSAISNNSRREKPLSSLLISASPNTYIIVLPLGPPFKKSC